MELLPPIPKTNRKFPIARPYGNPTGPISLVGKQDGAPAISVGLRRSAGDVPFIMSSTLGAPLEAPAVRKARAMLEDVQSARVKLMFKNQPPVLDGEIKRQKGAIDTIAAQIVVLMKRRAPKATIDALTAEKDIRQQIYEVLVNYKVRGLGQVPHYRNVPPDFLARPVMHAEGRRMMTNLAALSPMPSVADQVRELKQAYSAEAVSGKYVNDIKMAVRYDYGENPYAGYATARRDAQYNSPAFMGSAYFHPDQFQNRGISLAGGLGTAPNIIGNKSNFKNISPGNRGLRPRYESTLEAWGAANNAPIIDVPKDGIVTIDSVQRTQGGTIMFPATNGYKAFEVVAATYQGRDGFIIWRAMKEDGTPEVWFQLQSDSANAVASGTPAELVAAAPGEKPPGIPETAWNWLKSLSGVIGFSLAGIGSWWNALPMEEKRMYWQTLKAALKIDVSIPALESGNTSNTNTTTGFTPEQLAALAKTKEDNTALYIGLGVGALLVVGLIAVVAMKK